MARAFPLLTVNPAGLLGDNASLMLHIRLGEMLEFARHIDDPARVAELHNMRIAAKRLRYTMELFQPYVTGPTGKSLGGLLDRTKKIQELIGEIHDRDVRVPLVGEFLSKHEREKPEIRVGLVRLMEQEAAERERLYRQLLSYWDEQREKYVARFMELIAAMALNSPAPKTKTSPASSGAGDEEDASADADRGDQ